MKFHIYTVKLISRVADRDCTFDSIPAVRGVDAMEHCRAMLSAPAIWLPIKATDEAGKVTEWGGE